MDERVFFLTRDRSIWLENAGAQGVDGSGMSAWRRAVRRDARTRLYARAYRNYRQFSIQTIASILTFFPSPSFCIAVGKNKRLSVRYTSAALSASEADD